MIMTTKPEASKTPKKRSPELVAAGAAIELAKIDAAITKAKETIAEKDATKKAILAALEPNVLELLNRLRGTAKG